MKKLLVSIMLLLALCTSCTVKNKDENKNKEKSFSYIDHKAAKDATYFYFITEDRSSQVRFSNTDIREVYLEYHGLRFIFSSKDEIYLTNRLGVEVPFSRTAEINILVTEEDFHKLRIISDKIRSNK